MANETIGGIKRLSDQIGGDDRWDVNITGGDISNVTITDSTASFDSVTVTDATVTNLTATGTLILPQSTSASPTAEGSIAWDTDDNLLKVGNGAIASVMVDTASGQTLENKTLTQPTIAQIRNSGGTLTLPAATNDTLVGRSTNDTLTNKAMNGLSNTFTNIPLPTAVTGVLGSSNGGTGVNNGSRTITLGGNLTTSGAFATVLTVTGATNITLPTTGTLATLAGTETLSNKTLTAPAMTGLATAEDLTISSDLVVPFGVGVAPIAEGNMKWDSASNVLTVGSGVATKTMVDTDSTQTLTNKAINSSTSDSFLQNVDYPNAVIQHVYTQTGTGASGTTIFPTDNTIPQNTEGTEFMTVAITPKSATNILVIEVHAQVAVGTADRTCGGGIFQDSTANALAANGLYNDGLVQGVLRIKHVMIAGTTSATTFKFRAGPSSAATVYFNRNAGGTDLYGGVCSSSISVTEFRSS